MLKRFIIFSSEFRKMTSRLGARLRESPNLLNRHNASRLILLQYRTIVSKELFKLPDNYPEPWPYREHSYKLYQVFTNVTKPRFHVNSRLITVEGNIAAGKSTFAADLADKLGFFHMPEFSMEDIMVDRYGNDRRDFYDLFPKRFRVPDVNMFYQNPRDDQTAVMQDLSYRCRWEQYLNALAHIFNTGQGVVLERTPHSEFVFVNAMRSKDWISPEYFKYYLFQRKLTLWRLPLKPHLILYLDTPVDKCLENIRKRGNQHEINAVDADYLKVMEDSYKDYLREMKRFCHILSYDWREPELTDVVVEDIEHLDFDTFEWHSGDIGQDWNTIGDNMHYGFLRFFITDKQHMKFLAFEKLMDLETEISELYIYPPDMELWKNVMIHEVLKDRCTYGYTKRDPITISGLFNFDKNRVMPEEWHEYWYKEAYFDSIAYSSRCLDPLGKSYEAIKDPHRKRKVTHH